MRGSVKFFLFLAGSALAWAQPAPNLEAARKLVELKRVLPEVHLEVRYATTNNFMKRRLYSAPRVFVRQEVGEALAKVQARLARRGLGLLVFDGYRPWRVTKMMWDETPEEKRYFVADPAKGSKHNRGGAVDLTLWDEKAGRALEMTSAYDEFSERAIPTYSGGSARARANRELLRQVMEDAGFIRLPKEWWHFDYKDWKSFPLLDYSFEELDQLR
jgi:D-alanyl-D-alanine dipeptidase